MACLEDIQSTAHVALAQPDQRVHRLGANLHILLVDNLDHQLPDVGLLQRTEAEARAAAQQRGAELVRVIGNDAEARVGRVLFHDAAQRHLRRVGHGVGLVEDNQLVPRHGCFGAAAHAEDLLGGGKRLDLLAHHVDAAVVGRVELQHHLPHLGGTVDAPREGQDGRGLARAGRAVEEQVRQAVGVDKLVNGGEDVLVAFDVVEGLWSVLFDPAEGLASVAGHFKGEIFVCLFL